MKFEMKEVHLRYKFAEQSLVKIVAYLGERLVSKNSSSPDWYVNGNFAQKSISKINQAKRIMDYYRDQYLIRTGIIKK